MKRTKTLSFKLSVIFFGGVAFSMAAGAFATYFVQERIVKNFITSRLKNSVYEYSKATDNDFVRAQNTIDNRKHMVESFFQTKEDLTNDIKITTAIEEISTIFDSSSHEYNNVCAYYVVLNPKFTGGTETDEEGKGFFHIKNNEGDFVSHPVTNILKFEENQFENVGWWYCVANKTESSWTHPYYNANIDQNMISFVCPFYSENKQDFLGIIGIDIDLNEIISDVDEKIKSAGEYVDAYSLLLNSDETIIYHKDVKTFDDDGKFVGTSATLKDITSIENFKSSMDGALTYKYRNHRRTAMSISFSNGLTYGVSVRTSELRRPIRSVTFIPFMVYLVTSILLVVVIYLLIIRYIKPLQDLHTAVDKAKKGDYKYKIKPVRDDEIGDLTKAYSELIDAISEKNRMISAMAYIDGLTGVKNNNAYRDAEKRLNEAIKEGKAKFAVAMLDVDRLKMINDNLGHETGDQAIVGSCYTLCKAFSHSPVFRIGGDEFVAIIENSDYENRQEIYKKLRNNMIKVRDTKYEFSIGMATFEPGVDKSFKDVFNRADQEMYLNKKAKRKYE